MLKKWFAIIFDHRLSLKERMFRVVTGICMIALAIILPMGKSFINLLILAASLVCMSLVVKFSIRKNCVNAGATAIAFLLLLVFPVSFFTAGGFYSGMPEWFVLCFVYISITLEGRRKVFFFLLGLAETLICYYIAYYFPEFVARNTTRNSFFDSAFSVVLVSILISILLSLLTRLYEEENELAKEQKKEIEELNKAENNFFSSMSP